MCIVLLDVDEVVADFVSRYLGCLFAATGKRFTYQDITQWDLVRALKITETEHDAALALVRKNLDLALLPGAAEGVRGLLADGHDVVFVTAPQQQIPEWAHEREAWLGRHFSECPVIHTRHKAYIRGDMLVDDRITNVLGWGLHNPLGRPVIWAKPWNSETVPIPTDRTDSWAKIRQWANEEQN